MSRASAAWDFATLPPGQTRVNPAAPGKSYFDAGNYGQFGNGKHLPLMAAGVVTYRLRSVDG